MYHKGYSICSHSFSYGFHDKTFLVLQFDCRYMQDVYSMTLRNYINFFFNFRTKIVTNVHNVVQMSKIVNGERNPNKIVDQLRSSFLKQRNPSTVASICQARTNPQMKFDTRMLPCFRSRFNYMYFLVATAIGVLKSLTRKYYWWRLVTITSAVDEYWSRSSFSWDSDPVGIRMKRFSNFVVIVHLVSNIYSIQP